MVHMEGQGDILVNGEFSGIGSGNGNVEEDMYSMVLGKE